MLSRKCSYDYYQLLPRFMQTLIYSEDIEPVATYNGKDKTAQLEGWTKLKKDDERLSFLFADVSQR